MTIRSTHCKIRLTNINLGSFRPISCGAKLRSLGLSAGCLVLLLRMAHTLTVCGSAGPRVSHMNSQKEKKWLPRVIMLIVMPALSEASTTNALEGNGVKLGSWVLAPQWQGCGHFRSPACTINLLPTPKSSAVSE